jgi:L-fuculose-phosphate aldolase
MYQRGLITAADGNVSARVGDRLLITPSGLCKGYLEPEHVVVTDLDGKKIDGGPYRASSEFAMHVAIYQERPDVASVCHAHPCYATAFSLTDVSLSDPLLSEVLISFGAAITAPYATPTTTDVPEVIRPLVREGDVIILRRHGAVTVGRDVFDAFRKMESLEHAAKITWLARTLGRVAPLPQREVDKILGIREKLGIEGRVPGCISRGACHDFEKSGGEK